MAKKKSRDLGDLVADRGLTLTEVAAATEISAGHLSDIKNRKEDAGPKATKRLARYFKLPVPQMREILNG